jgi:aryl-alcohol dehydrogenase-like predicted oxidoreductase
MSQVSRRQIIKQGIALGVGLAGIRAPVSFAEEATALPLILRPIPSSGETLPVIGIGAYRYKRRRQMEERRKVLGRLPEIGGTVVDTAHAYGDSEAVIGEFTSSLGNRSKLFIATKLTAPEGDITQGEAMFAESLRRLQTDRIDLIQVHNMTGADAILPKLLEWKQAGKVRYVGITTSKVSEHPQMLEIMRKQPIDFIQVDYSLGNRDAAYEILPLAQERRIGVLVNLPFGGRKRARNLIAQAGKQVLPEWAAEFDARSWAQFFLKYIVSHPAVTCAIPGTTQIKHLEDNNRGGRGRLPDEATRRKMEHFWDVQTRDAV